MSDSVPTLEEPTAAVSAELDAPAPANLVAPERLTPHEWAERKGHIEHADPARPWRSPNIEYRYAAADALYGWSRHAYHYQAEHDRFLIAESDYDAALEAAAQYPAKPPHRAAVAPSCPYDFGLGPAEGVAREAKETR